MRSPSRAPPRAARAAAATAATARRHVIARARAPPLARRSASSSTTRVGVCGRRCRRGVGRDARARGRRRRGALVRAIHRRERCPASIEGEWREDKSLGDGLCALIAPLGVPKLACPIVDAVRTELAIACDDDGRGVTIVDKTTLSSANETRVRFDGGEVEKTTRGGRKKFMLAETRLAQRAKSSS